VLAISRDALADGCDRARNLFRLNRLAGPARAQETAAAVFAALGIDEDARPDLERAIADIVPIAGAPALEAAIGASMLTGVLVGLLIADSALPVDEIDLPVTRS
jgi:phosphohistidine swiveling domain-containing protein